MPLNRSIPFFNYAALFAEHEDELSKVILDVCRRGAYIMQQDLRHFEEKLQSFLNVKHVFGVADGTNAIILALHAADIGPGHEVILPSHTYVATAAAVHYVGATPVLVECGADHMVDPESVRKAVTDKTRAIMPVQLNGRTADMAALQSIADKHGLVIIEDAAQALGSKFNDRYAGTFGSAGTFSFYPAKLLGCFGDGGAVVTNDSRIAERISLLRDHGRNADGDVVDWGTNSRLDNLQAAILNFKLTTFGNDIERRRAIAHRYHLGLSGLDQIVLPPMPNDHGTHFDVYQNYEIEAERRDELRKYLEDKGVKTIVQFGGRAVHQYDGLGFRGVSLPFTEKMYTRCMLLPMNTTLSDDDVNYVIDLIQHFYKVGL